MELVDGQALDRMIPDGGLPADRILQIAVPIADALVAAHDKGIVHRDLKPANVMVAADGGSRCSTSASPRSIGMTRRAGRRWPPSCKHARGSSWARCPTCRPSRSPVGRWITALTFSRWASFSTRWRADGALSRGRRRSSWRQRFCATRHGTSVTSGPTFRRTLRDSFNAASTRIRVSASRRRGKSATSAASCRDESRRP